jgi:cereblon
MSITLPSPASHSYLGEGQVELESREVLICEKEYEILLYPLPDIVLFPGETIPLRIHNRQFIRRFIQQRSQSLSNPMLASHIGIVHVSRAVDLLNSLGTTMEICMNFSPSFNESEMAVTGKGRHRFQILQVMASGGVYSAKIKILDDTLPQFAAVSDYCNPFPRWVYESLSPERLGRVAYVLFRSTLLWIGQDDSILQRWGSINIVPTTTPSNPWRTDKSRFPELQGECDPIAFSYFLCANMPVDCSILQLLLQQVTIVDRFRIIIKLLQDGLTKQMVCSRCNQALANKQDLFNVSGSEGLSNIYVNRYGSVHQTMTLRKLLPEVILHLEGPPSTEDTWFPGYAWTIMYCGRCHQHLGWKYDWVGGEHIELVDEDDENRSDDYGDIEDDDINMEAVDEEDEDYFDAQGDHNNNEPEEEDDDDLMAMPHGAAIEDLEESSEDGSEEQEDNVVAVAPPNVTTVEVDNSGIVMQFW